MKYNYNFLGLPPQYSSYGKARIVFLPVPYEGTVSYGHGTSKGPDAIIRASPQIEYHDEELDAEQWQHGFHTLPALKTSKDPAATANLLYNEMKKHSGKFVVVLGGEHSITAGEVLAYKERYPRLSILQLDAHADLRDEWDGSRHSHACAMRRAFEICPNIVQAGIRNISAEEMEFVRKAKHDGIFFAHRIRQQKDWIKKAVDRLSDDVFITIDVDAFDSAIMPATGTPEPGGLDWYQVTSLLREVAKRKNIVGFDVVELAPIKGMHACDFTAAKLVYRLIGYVFEKKKL